MIRGFSSSLGSCANGECSLWSANIICCSPTKVACSISTLFDLWLQFLFGRLALPVNALYGLQVLSAALRQRWYPVPPDFLTIGFSFSSEPCATGEVSFWSASSIRCSPTEVTSFVSSLFDPWLQCLFRTLRNCRMFLMVCKYYLPLSHEGGILDLQSV